MTSRNVSPIGLGKVLKYSTSHSSNIFGFEYPAWDLIRSYIHSVRLQRKLGSLSPTARSRNRQITGKSKNRIESGMEKNEKNCDWMKFAVKFVPDRR